MSFAMRLTILLLAAVALARAADYCTVCTDHTLCKYSGPSSSCSGLVTRNFTTEEITAILDKHNTLRNSVASGSVKNGTTSAGQPSAANMKRLYWDDEIAAIAARWATQCTFAHDTCRSSEDGTYVGQNIVLTSDTVSNMTVVVQGGIQAWFDEVASFNGSTASEPFQADEKTGHYTQLVWASTTRVGCGFAQYNVTSGQNRLVVCNYKPGGNFIGDVMYVSGTAASQCGSTGVDTNYTSLCV